MSRQLFNLVNRHVTELSLFYLKDVIIMIGKYLKWSLTFTVMCIVYCQSVFAQCYIKSTDQSEGHITYYLDPELVAQSDKMGIALSVQMVGNSYYLATTYQFATNAQPVEERIALSLKS